MIKPHQYVKFRILLGWIHDRIRRNKNAIITVHGQTGSGKSYACLAVAYYYSHFYGSLFDIKNNLDFNSIELVKKTMLEVNNKPGIPYIFEEIGSYDSGSSSQEFYSKRNKLFASFTQTNRCKNQVLLFNAPSFKDVDSKIRRLIHCQLIMKSVNLQSKSSTAEAYFLQQNVQSEQGKTYYKKMRYTPPGTTRKAKLKMIDIPLPPKHIVDKYEEVKEHFVNELNKKIIASEVEVDKKSNRFTKADLMDKDTLSTLIDKGLNAVAIAKMFKVTRQYSTDRLNAFGLITKRFSMPSKSGV